MKKTCRLTLSFLASLFCINPIYAQDDAFWELPIEELAQIKVTVGSLFLEDDLYIGSTVTKITEQQWRKQGAEKTFDALEHVPGVYLSEYFHGQTVPVFRGFFGANQYNSFLVLLDGIPLNNYSSASATYGTPNFALPNLNNIEVIRGPGSALYGADAFNGVVSLNSWNSDKEVLEIGAKTGSFGYWETSIRFHSQLTNKLSLTSTISGSSVDDKDIDNSFSTSGTGLTIKDDVDDDYNNISTSHKLKYGNSSLAFYYSSHETEDTFGTSEVVPFLPNGHHTNGDTSMMAMQLQNLTTLTKKWELESRLYYIKDSLVGEFGLNVGAAPEEKVLIWDTEDNRTGASFILKKPLNQSNNQIILGLNYDHYQADKFNIRQFSIPLNRYLTPVLLRNKNRDVFGLTGQYEWRSTDNKYQFILGGRYDRYSDFGDDFSPRIAFIYHPKKNSAVKVLYGNAFRAPSLNEQTSNALVGSLGDRLNPEQVDTIEVSWINKGKNWRYGLTTYFSKSTDVINVGPSLNPSFAIEYTNNGEVESYGFEFEAYHEWSNWNATLIWSYNESQVKKPMQSDIDSYPQSMVDWIISYKISERINITLSNKHLFNRVSESVGGIGTVIQEKRLGPYWRTNLQASWFPSKEKQLEVYMNVDDLLDRKDRLTGITQIENGNATAGREFKTGLRYTF